MTWRPKFNPAEFFLCEGPISNSLGRRPLARPPDQAWPPKSSVIPRHTKIAERTHHVKTALVNQLPMSLETPFEAIGQRVEIERAMLHVHVFIVEVEARHGSAALQ